MIINGQWIGWGLGDHSTQDFTVQRAKEYMRRMYRSYCSDLDDTNIFDQSMQDHVMEMQRRLVADGHLTPGKYYPGVLDWPTELAMGFKKPPPPVLPVCVSVEGHMSNMFFGPVADTFTLLEKEGRCRHQPTGYQNGSVPFNNQDGVNALDENIRLRTDPNRPIIIGGYSQGMIVVHDYLEQHGIPPNLKGVLMYGNPCRQTNSVAPWCDSATIAAAVGTHGLDPIKRFGVTVNLGNIPFVDVFRKGDIFAQNGDDTEGQCKAAVYEAVARGKLFGNPMTLASQIAHAMGQPIAYVLPIVMATMSGMGFLATNPNPHYAPYDLTGGINWTRGLLTNG